MQSELLSTWNWSRAFSISIEGIQICLHPVVELEKRIIKGGWLRKVRKVRSGASGFVLVFFLVHCTQPRLEAAPNLVRLAPVDLARGYVEVGLASFYGDETDGFEGLTTASGEVCSSETLTCAHRTLPLGTFVKVENLDTGQGCILRVNDRGPYVKGRVLDVSPRGAELLGFTAQGVVDIQLRVVDASGNPIFTHSAALDDAAMASTSYLPLNLLKADTEAERLSQGMNRIFTGEGALRFRNHGMGIKFLRAAAHGAQSFPLASSKDKNWKMGDMSVDPFIVRRD